jgi:4'-phosphopantetheinyl transferase
MLDLARATRDSSMTTACDDTRVTLGSRHAHLWWIRPDTLTDPAEIARCRALLTDDEREKTDRFRFARDRHACLVTRVLVRATLSRYCDVPPARWRFRTTDHGRPEIVSPPSKIRFNLSHTKGLVVCLVSLDREVGVDVESLDRATRWGDLAERFFAPREAAALRRLEASEGPTRFLEYWTLKESYIKARGLGLAIPLTGFSFDLPAQAPDDIRIRFTPAVDDDAARWQFTLGRFGGDHLVATAVERDGSEPVRIALHEAVAPLA